MNRIEGLIAAMREIPGKEKRATQLQDMRIVRDMLARAAERATTLRKQSDALSLVDGAVFVNAADKGLSKVASRASALKKRHEEGADFDRRRADQTLTLINEGLEGVGADLSKGWRNLIDEQTKRYRPLADAAARVGLSGASGLSAAIALLEGWREAPPNSRQAAETYVTDASRLPTAVASLGLGGRAGKFMIDASNGRAKAKDLQEKEVLAFLEAHPAIWAMLKVTL